MRGAEGPGQPRRGTAAARHNRRCRTWLPDYGSVADGVGVPLPAEVLGVDVGVSDGVTLDVAVRVTGDVVTVTVGVTTTTEGVTVTVVVGGGTLLVCCVSSPRSDVPDPLVPWTTSVSGRPAISSIPVTTRRTPANTLTHAAANTCHV